MPADIAGAASAASAAADNPAGCPAAAESVGLKKQFFEAIVGVGKDKVGKGEQLMSTIARLKAEQIKLKQDRAAVSKSLKNATKRKNRLKTRARQLTDADLVEVLQMRAANAANLDGMAAQAPVEEDVDLAARSKVLEPAADVEPAAECVPMTE